MTRVAYIFCGMVLGFWLSMAIRAATPEELYNGAEAVGYAPGSPTWHVIRTWEAPRHGAGSFLSFEARNLDGKWLGGVTLNGGLVDATPGHEQGDLDVVFLVDSRPAIVAFTGSWQGSLPGIQVWPSDFLAIGSPGGRFTELHLTPVPCPPSAPTPECVRVSGGYVPLYK